MAEPDANAILGAVLERLKAGLEDSGVATGEGLLRMAIAARGLWDVLGDLARLGVAGRVTLETTLAELVSLLPPDAQAALGVVGDRGTPDPVTVTYDLARRIARVGVPRAAFRGLALGEITVGLLEAEEVRICVTGPFDALTITFSARRVVAAEVALARRTRTSAARLEVERLAFEARDLAPDPRRVDDPKRPLRASVTAERGSIDGLAHDPLAADRLEGDALRAELDQRRAQVTLTALRGAARGVSLALARAEGGVARDLRVRITDRGGSLPLLDNRPDRLAIEVRAARVEGDALALPLGEAAAAWAGPVHACAGPDGFTLDAERGEVRGLSGALAPAGGGAPAPWASWLRAAGHALREVDARATAELPPGHLGVGPAAVHVEPDTHADAALVVRDGRIDADRTSFRFDRPLDGPLWTDIRGAVLTDAGRAKVEVGGFPDPDVTRIVAWLLDLPERRIPLEVGTLADHVADRLAQGDAPALPVAAVPVAGEAARLVLADLELPLGSGRIAVARAWVEEGHLTWDGETARATVGRAEAEGLLLRAPSAAAADRTDERAAK